MKKFILAIVQTTTRFVVRTLMLVTPTRIQIHVFSRLIDACLASEKFDQELFRYIFAKTFYRLNPGGEKPGRSFASRSGERALRQTGCRARTRTRSERPSRRSQRSDSRPKLHTGFRFCTF